MKYKFHKIVSKTLKIDEIQKETLLLTYYDKEISMCACEYWNVHGNAYAVRLVETDTKVPFSAQEQEDEHTNVHQTNASCKK